MENTSSNPHEFLAQAAVGDAIPRGIEGEATIEKAATNPQSKARGKTTVSKRPWGWFPTLAVVNALGMLVVASIYGVARFTDGEWLLRVYWVGMMVMLAPIVARLMMRQVARHERLALIVLLAFSFYLFKALVSPNYIYLGDEFVHWRSTNDILVTGELYNPNPLLPTSAYYPGLQNVTVALATLSGFNVYHSELLTLWMAQLVLVLSLYLLYEYVTDSHWIAGLATVFYMSNANYIFYGQQFGYESMSLPIMALVIYLLSRRAIQGRKTTITDYTVVIIFLILSIVPTHHMTSYALIAFLMVWTLAVFLERRGLLKLVDRMVEWIESILQWLGRRVAPLRWAMNQLSLLDFRLRDYPKPDRNNIAGTRWITALTIAATVAWLFGMATITVGYLAPVLGGAVEELMKLIAGEMGAKEAFKSNTGMEPPPWERYIGFAAVGLICLGLPFGWLQGWRQFRNKLPVVVLVAWSALFPVTLAMRMTEAGAETAQRSSEFLYIGMGLMLSIAIVELFLKRGVVAWRVGIATIYTVIVFGGGVVMGHAWWARLPGEYVLGGDTRSLQPQSVEAAKWMADHSGGRDHVVLGDGLSLKLSAAYGQQFPLRGVSWVIFSSRFAEGEQQAIYDKDVSYLVLDYRMTEYLPINGHYIESGEPNADRHTEVLNPQSIDKFDEAANVSRYFHSGDIRMFDVSYYSQSRQDGQ